MKSRDKLHRALRLLKLAPDSAFLRAGLQSGLQTLMELDLSTRIDAAYYERSEDRRAYRNGYRTRTWRTQAGDISVRIPKLRTGTYMPAFINTSTEHILSEILYHSYMRGLPSVPQLNEMLKHTDLPYLQHQDYAHLHAHLYDFVEYWRNQPVSTSHAGLWLDVIDLSHNDGRSLKLLVALAVDPDGNYLPLDFGIANSDDDEVQWRNLLRRLITRGVNDVRIVFSADVGNLRVMVRGLFNAEWQYQRPNMLEETLYFITENNRDTLVHAVSDLFIRVTDAHGVMMPHSDIYTWQPVSMLATAA